MIPAFISRSFQQVTGQHDLGDVLRGAGTMLIIRAVAMLIAYASLIALARWMGAAEYGAFAYVFAWIAFLAMPAGLGIPAASVRFLPEYSARRSPSLIRGLLGRGAELTIGTGIVIAAVAMLIILEAGDRVPHAYRIPLIIGLAGIPVTALLTLQAQIGRAFGWIAMAYSPTQIWHPLLLLLAAGVLLATHTSLNAAVLVPVSVTLAGLCALVQALSYMRRLRPTIRGIAPEYDQRAWLRVSGPLLLIDGFAAIINYSDILLVGLFAGPVAVAFYTAASRSAAIVLAIYGSIGALTGPRMAELNAKGERQELQKLLSGIVPWISILPGIAAVALAIAGPFVLRLFGHGFDAAWPALVLLAFANLIASITGPSALLLNMTGHQDSSATVYGLAALGNILLNLFLIPRFGLTGAAVGTTIATVASNVVLVVIAKRKLGLHTSFIGINRQVQK
ncbi:MAG: flippase [Thermoanaerobaculia bacterium]